MNDTEREQDPDFHESKKIDVVEERLVVDKEKVSKGKVVLHKRVIEEDIPFDLNLTEEHIDIEVKKIGEVVIQPGPAIRVEGDTTIYSVYREVYVKQTILEEEVRITKKRSNKPYHSSETLRREIIDVERISGNDLQEEIASRKSKRDDANPRAGSYNDEQRQRDPHKNYDNTQSVERSSPGGSQGDFSGYSEQGDVAGYNKLKQ